MSGEIVVIPVNTVVPGDIECVAVSTEGTPEVSLWECPCRECTKMAWEGSDSPDTLKSYRHEWWRGWYG